MNFLPSDFSARRGSPRRAWASRALAAAVVLATLAPISLRAQDTSRVKLPPGGVITLQEAIRIALAQNSSARFARNSLKLDSLAITQARNQFQPNLTGSASAGQGWLNGTGGDPFSSSVGISSGLTIYNGGQNRNILRQSRTLAQAGIGDVGRTQQSVVFNVASDFLALITQQEQLRVQQENLTAQEQELTQLQEFVRRGTRPIGDLYQQQAAVASTRLAMVNARRGTEVARVNLIQELVLDPRFDYAFATQFDTTDVTQPAFNLDSLVTVAYQQRVDLRSQELRVQAAQTEIAIAEGTRLPTVSGSVGYGTAFNTAQGGGFASQVNERRGGSLGVNVAVPILDRGASSIAKQRAQVQLENELLTLRDLQESVALDVRRAYLDYVSAGEQLAAAKAQQQAAALALQAAQARYRVGLTTLVEVTLARASLISAESALVSARSSLVFQRSLMSYYTGALDPTNVMLGT